jgi:hypothetical protein
MGTYQFGGGAGSLGAVADHVTQQTSPKIAKLIAFDQPSPHLMLKAYKRATIIAPLTNAASNNVANLSRLPTLHAYLRVKALRRRMSEGQSISDPVRLC